MITNQDGAYHAALKRYQEARGGERPDRNWRAFLRLVAGSRVWDRLAPAVNFERAAIDWRSASKAMGSASAGELVLYEVARVFYEGEGKVDLCELADRLDTAGWLALMEALAIYRG